MKKKIIILGAGISGLATCWFLKQKFQDQIEILVLEKNSQTGGLIKTTSETFLFEWGPRSCRTKGSGLYTLHLIEQLQLQDQLIKPSINAKQRYLFWKGKLRQIPNSFLNLLKSPWAYPLLLAPIKDLFAKRKIDDETIDAFARRRFGNSLAPIFMDALVTGIYAGNSRSLSIESCFPSLKNLEKKYGSIIIGAIKNRQNDHIVSPFVKEWSKQPLFSFRKGMETLTKSLEEKCREHIKVNASIVSLNFDKQKGYIQTETKDAYIADLVISTIPDFQLKQILGYSQFTPDHYTSVVVVCVGFLKPVLQKKGFGCIITTCEQIPLLGIVWDSDVFPEQNYYTHETRLTFMLGGERDASYGNKTDEDIRKDVIHYLNIILSIKEKPTSLIIKRIHRCIPQFEIEKKKQKEQFIQMVSKSYNNLKLLGSNYCGVSVNDCIKGAFDLVEQLSL